MCIRDRYQRRVRGKLRNRNMHRATRLIAHLSPQHAAEEKEYSWDEIKKHKSKTDTWIVIDGKVYDCNKDSPLKGSHSSGEDKFLADHPGGKKIIVMQGGKDASETFKEFHSKSILEKYGPGLCIGTVKA
eukprot:TRINITY_DN221_c0_g1_i3.p2 TRINITY_DN221_c0_g1~~TRINITY_DN221_c0_g1_i3.p2  ORF type:complete len:130 (+),score=45.40 TRINITY_DN221_c0_g1_i3:86-475(+)